MRLCFVFVQRGFVLFVCCIYFLRKVVSHRQSHITNAPYYKYTQFTVSLTLVQGKVLRSVANQSINQRPNNQTQPKQTKYKSPRKTISKLCRQNERHRLGLFTPLVLLPDLCLLLGGEVVGDVEGLADVLGGLALDHASDGGAGEVEKGLDVHVVSSEDELKEDLLLDANKVGVPLLDDFAHDGRLEGLLYLVHGGSLVHLAELNNLGEDTRLHVG